MLVKGAHRGLQLGAAALNCAARVLLEAVKFLWHIDMLAAASVCMLWICCCRTGDIRQDEESLAQNAFR